MPASCCFTFQGYLKKKWLKLCAYFRQPKERVRLNDDSIRRICEFLGGQKVESMRLTSKRFDSVISENRPQLPRKKLGHVCIRIVSAIRLTPFQSIVL